MTASLLLPVADALAQMLAQVSTVSETEQVPLAQALDRVLAEPVLASFDVPGYDNSAMDGYAVRAAEVKAGQALTLQGSALAGHAFAAALAPQSCVRIMTGAVLPAGADTVIMQEQVRLQDGKVIADFVPKVGENVRKAGEDLKNGQQVLSAGCRLTAPQLGLLASLGIADVAVRRKLKIAIFSTGDELVLPGQPLPEGHIYDSNRVVLRAMLQRLGVEVLDLGLLPDQPAAIRSAFQSAMRDADALITSAGVSVGDADYTRQMLSELGQVNFWKVAIKPGKPFAFGKLENCWFFGLPGNPVAAVVTLDQLVQPVLLKLAGAAVSPANQLTAVTTVTLKKQPGRADYQRGYYWATAEGLFVKNLGSQSSGMLSSIANANCYIVLPQDSGSVASGEAVTIQPFGQLLQ
ncbi:MAG: gephyrin-like molybdotransferase Glp [Alishewanella aestuarii]